MTTWIQKVNRHYESAMYTQVDTKFYQGSDYHNVGYWTEGTSSAEEASENLMEKLLDMVPNCGSTVLDVACGKGATTRFLSRRLAHARISGVNISMKQLDTAKTNAPECSFSAMDAAKLSFGGQTFDTVVCIEAAFHFNTRVSFLKEAYRVLDVGGHLLMTDILVRRWMLGESQLVAKDNYLRDIEEYHESLQNVGFRDIRIVDATEECWRRFLMHVAAWGINESGENRYGLRALVNYVAYQLRGYLGVKSYVLLSARKD
jgi:ubiquinone/menaquinone biosynthesis C-methylase UbiE